MRDMEFRVNFITNIITDFIFNLLKVIFIELIFLNTNQIAGFNKYQILFIFGTSFIILSIYMMFVFFNHIQIPNAIQTGRLDLVIVKPVSAQFMLSLRYFNIAGIGSAFFGVYLVVYSLGHLDVHPGLLNIFLYLILIFCGFIVYYSLALILFTFSFWTVKTGGFIQILVDMGEVMKYPHEIFPRLVQFILSFLFPLFMVAAYPAEIGMGKTPAIFALVNILISIIIFSCASYFMKFALKRYSSAGG